MNSLMNSLMCFQKCFHFFSLSDHFFSEALSVDLRGREPQWCGALVVLGVDVGLGRQQRFAALQIAVPRRHVQRL